MHEIHFYDDINGNSSVYDYFQSLSQKNDKDSRINHKKFQEYITVLQELGKAAGEPFIKHLDGEIWEIRPIRERVLFASWIEDSFILLHHFKKTTPKTPKREIDQAKRNLKDMRERSGIK